MVLTSNSQRNLDNVKWVPCKGDSCGNLEKKTFVTLKKLGRTVAQGGESILGGRIASRMVLKRT